MVELTDRQKQLVNKVMSILVKKIPDIQRESGNVSNSVIRDILLGVSPVLAAPKYRESFDNLVDAITDALPQANLIQTPEDDSPLGHQDDLFDRLSNVDTIPRTDTSDVAITPDDPPAGEFKGDVVAPGRIIPQKVLDRQDKMKKRGISSRFFPDITVGSPLTEPAQRRKRPSIFKDAASFETQESINVAKRKGEQRLRDGEI